MLPPCISGPCPTSQAQAGPSGKAAPAVATDCSRGAALRRLARREGPRAWTPAGPMVRQSLPLRRRGLNEPGAAGPRARARAGAPAQASAHGSRAARTALPAALVVAQAWRGGGRAVWLGVGVRRRHARPVCVLTRWGASWEAWRIARACMHPCPRRPCPTSWLGGPGLAQGFSCNPPARPRACMRARRDVGQWAACWPHGLARSPRRGSGLAGEWQGCAARGWCQASPRAPSVRRNALGGPLGSPAARTRVHASRRPRGGPSGSRRPLPAPARLAARRANSAAPGQAPWALEPLLPSPRPGRPSPAGATTRPRVARHGTLPPERPTVPDVGRRPLRGRVHGIRGV